MVSELALENLSSDLMKFSLLFFMLASPVMPLSAGEPTAGSGLPPLSQTLFPRGANRVDAELDALVSDDVEIWKAGLQFEQTRGSWKIGGGFGQTRHEIDYEPFTTTLPSRRTEDSQDFRFEIQKTISPSWTVLANAAYVDGFSDHRSVWISEFYDQSNGLNPLYSEADPGSVAVSVGGQWSYLPGLSSVLVTAGFSRADIVPGWGRELNPDSGRFELVSSDSELDTFSGSLVWKAAVNPNLTSQHTVRFSETEGRELRTQLQSEWAVGLGRAFYLRAQAGAAREDPDFEALYGGLTLVYEVSAQWQIDLGYRYYEDSGEINSANFNTAAPGIASREMSLGVLWKGESVSVRGSVGYYQTDFDPITNPVNDVFTNLYQDRDFVSSRLAFTYQF